MTPCPCCSAHGSSAAACSASHRGSADHSRAGVGLVQGWERLEQGPSSAPDDPLCSSAAATRERNKEGEDREPPG